MSTLSIVGRTLGCGLLVLAPFVLLSAYEPPESTKGDPVAAKPARYIGSKACKNCHAKTEKGETFEKWEAGPHAKAFETLATEEAKKVAAKAGVKGDPQKADECLKCHVTAHGVDKKKGIKRGFKVDQGVQCESCHGPGENHFKARFKASTSGDDPAAGMTDDEIVSAPAPAKCAECHNEKSPTYTPFCFKERMKKIRHLDPRKKRTEEEIKALEEKCEPDCKVCAEEKKKDGDDK